jgi:hypothetical protein
MVKMFHILVLLLVLGITPAKAQQTAPASPAPAVKAAPASAHPMPVTPPLVGGLTPEELNKPFSGSFFLTPLEVAAVQQALKGSVIKNITLAAPDKPIPTHRVIRVSGVFYRSPENWVVWMNNQKVTPDNLLPEIVDISVKDSSKVALKWYDVGLNEVISITLRPQQTYDIPTGVLLPGNSP